MPRVGFELTTPVFERANTVHAFYSAATAKGEQNIAHFNVKVSKQASNRVYLYSNDCALKCWKLDVPVSLQNIFIIDEVITAFAHKIIVKHQSGISSGSTGKQRFREFQSFQEHFPSAALIKSF
jgi:hypothetical protein